MVDMILCRPSNAYFKLPETHPQYKEVETLLKAYNETKSDLVNDLLLYCYYNSCFFKEKI